MITRQTTIEVVTLMVILALAAYLRLHNIAQNPAWYADEATHVNIAQNLLRGEWRYLAVQDSVLVFGRMPLFEWLLAAVSGIFGASMATLRTLTATLGVLTVFTLYGAVRLNAGGRVLALGAAFALSVYPSAVLYNRLGFSYALSAPLVVITLGALMRYWYSDRREWLGLAVAAVGFGVLSDVLMGTFIVALAIIVMLRRWYDVLWAVPLCFVPVGVFILLNGSNLDALYTFNRLNTLSLMEQWDNVVLNYTVLLASSVWFPLGVLGLFLLRCGAVVALILWSVPFLLLARTVALFQLSFYYMIPLLPLIALGVASAIIAGVRALMPLTRMQRGAAGLLAALLIGIPLLNTLSVTLDAVHNGYTTDIDPFLVEAADAQDAANYINAQTAPDDVVIASPAVAWLLDANAADPQMSVAYIGVETVHLPPDIPSERFAFDPRFAVARYVVVDNIWRHWSIHHVPTLAAQWQIMQDEWALVYISGDVAIYERPAR